MDAGNTTSEPFKKRNAVVTLSRCQTQLSGLETQLLHRIEGSKGDKPIAEQLPNLL